ncbi:MAG: alpha/beta fold hydrolase [Pseudomonadales bacterium]|nr:alpha/beta fold hydrolase [Pseudomonadales bacterium]
MTIAHKNTSKALFIAFIIFISLALFNLHGCKSAPVEQEYAADNQANLQYVKGNPFLHAVYVNTPAFEHQTKHSKGRFLHVYIEGDGKAFEDGKVTLNPTPENPMVLRLMSQDTESAIYLGRPCYFNPKDDQCSPNAWTRERYSAKVVNSMATALQTFSAAYDGVVLIGHSGGGTLAALLAEKARKTVMIVTLAGNLDTFAWSVQHNYQPLKASLNPADRPPLPSHILQIHYAGANDTVIDPDWVQDFADRQHRAEFHRLLDVDHVDGWEEFWPQVLDKLKHYQQFVQPKG